MDFTQMPVSQGHKYLLVMIDTFTRWIEGFPTQTEKAEEVVNKQTKKHLLHEIIPRFRLPRSLQSGNGTSFTYKVTQGVSKAFRSVAQSCPTLCDPIDGSPPGSHVPGILQARTLEWVAISLSNA